MAMTYCMLSSGSAGNCLWVRGGGVELLVDCGLSARGIERRLSDNGFDMAGVTAAVFTHGHWDHVRAAAVLARRHGVELYGTAHTLSLIRGDPPTEKLHAMQPRGRFSIGGLQFRAVATMHDSPGSCAFVIEDGETRMGVITDLGIVTESIVRNFQGLDGLVLEMNHDEQMLRDGPYPSFLKRRIHGEMGHLSNKQGGDLLAHLAHPGLQHLTLAHLSEENNRPDKALDVARGVLASAGFRPTITVASARESAEPVLLEGRGQLSLGPW